MIRRYEPDDLPRLKEITAICFEGVAIDHNIEQRFGLIGGRDWRWRKARHIDQDVAGGNAEGVFVAEEAGHVIGYISGRADHESKIGWIANISVLPKARGRGWGSQLMDRELAYFREEGMECAKIETLAQNEIGSAFYPSRGFQEVARQIHYVMRL